MSPDHLRITSNWHQLDAAPLRRGFARFLTGAMSDGSFRITPVEEPPDEAASHRLLTEHPGTATLPMTEDGQKGTHE